jgi:hypothetical protein
MKRRGHYAKHDERNGAPRARRNEQRCDEELQQRNRDDERRKRRVLRGEFPVCGAQT